MISNLEHSHLIDCMRQLHLGALGFVSGLRVIKMIIEQIQYQSQRLIFSQCTYYNPTLRH